MANEEVLGPRKTMFVLVIVVGCFAVLWPRILSPLILGNARDQLKPNQFDREAGCCEVMFASEVAVLELINEVCNSVVHADVNLSPYAAAECRKAVNETCGVDIAAFLKRDENVGRTSKKLVHMMKTSNSSCLKEHFGVPQWNLGVHTALNSWTQQDTLKQERPTVRAGPHPALRERGRAIPPGTPSPARAPPVTMPPHARVRTSPLSVYFELDIKPPPIPGMRPPLGSPGGPVTVPKSSMGFVMPIYTICIIVFFVYTLSKILFKRTGTTPYEAVSPDPRFRRRVFRDDSRTSPDKLVVTAISGLVAEVRQQMEASYAQNQQRQDQQDNHARPYTNGTVLHNTGPVHIVASEYREESKERSPEPAKDELTQKEPSPESAPEPKDSTYELADSAPEPKESTPEPDKSVPEPKQSALEPAESAPEPKESALEPAESAPEPKQSSPEPAELAPEPKESSLEPAELAPEPKESVPEPAESGPKPKQSSPEPAESASEPKESTPEPAESAPEPKEPTPELEQSSPEREEFSPDREKSSPELEESIPEPKESTPEPKEAPESEEPIPEQKDTSPETKEEKTDIADLIKLTETENAEEIVDDIIKSTEDFLDNAREVKVVSAKEFEESPKEDRTTPELLEEALKEDSPEKESEEEEEEEEEQEKPSVKHEAEEVKSIFLETQIPQQSRVLVAEFEDNARAPAEHSPMVVSGKMTLSLIQDAPRDTPERDLESTVDDFTTASAVTQPAAEKDDELSEEEIEEDIEIEEIEEEVEEEEEEEEEPQKAQPQTPSGAKKSQK